MEPADPAPPPPDEAGWRPPGEPPRSVLGSLEEAGSFKAGSLKGGSFKGGSFKGGSFKAGKSFKVGWQRRGSAQGSGLGRGGGDGDPSDLRDLRGEMAMLQSRVSLRHPRGYPPLWPQPYS